MNNILAGIVLYNPQIERLILELKSIEKQVQKICMFDNGNIHPLLWGGYKVYGVRICG